MKDEPVVIEKVLNAPIDRVWRAITNKEDMKQWYFDLADFKAEVGFEFQFEGGPAHKSYLHRCKVTEVVPGKKLTYSWRYDGYAGNSFVTWELFKEGSQTRLKLTHSGLETFPKENPDLAKGNFVQGWTDIVGNLLPNFVEMEVIHKSVIINALPARIWDVLINANTTKLWAAAFSEGTFVESDWKKGSSVVWKDKDGNVGARGIVVTNEPPRLLKVSFSDNPDVHSPLIPGVYSETYEIVESGKISTLKIEAGLLQRMYAATHSPLWDKALERIKSLAEQ